MKFPLATDGFSAMVDMVIKIEPEFEFGGTDDQNPKQKTTSANDGHIPKWIAHFVMTEPDGFGTSEIVQVKFAAEKAPHFDPTSVPVFHRLWANAWNMGIKKGTSIIGEGLSFKTRSAPKPEPKAPQPRPLPDQRSRAATQANQRPVPPSWQLPGPANTSKGNMQCAQHDSTPDPEHLSLADKIIAGAAGSPTTQAAAIIVTEAVHGRLLEQLALSSTGADWAEINWPATVRTTGHLSGGERRLIALAASLATGEPVDLNDTLTGLDSTNARVVLEAIGYAMGFKRPPRPGGER